MKLKPLLHLFKAFRIVVIRYDIMRSKSRSGSTKRSKSRGDVFYEYPSKGKVKLRAYAYAALSCGRSSPVTLGFEPVVDIIHTPEHRATVKSGLPQFTFPVNGSQLPTYTWYPLLLGGQRL